MSNQGQEGGDLDPRPGSTRQLVVRVYPKIALAYFVAATSCLMLIAFLLMIFAFVEVGSSIFTGDHVEAALSAISLLVIGFAVVETAKFIAEEEIMRKRELRSSTESRRSITKFITIIVIAASSASVRASGVSPGSHQGRVCTSPQVSTTRALPGMSKGAEPPQPASMIANTRLAPFIFNVMFNPSHRRG